MQSLHDMLKQRPAEDRGAAPREDLRRRYSKIGISAVAAAARFNGKPEVRSEETPAAADRPTERA